MEDKVQKQQVFLQTPSGRKCLIILLGKKEINIIYFCRNMLELFYYLPSARLSLALEGIFNNFPATEEDGPTQKIVIKTKAE